MTTTEKQNTRTFLLAAAESVVNGSRQDVYSGPEQNFQRIALLWSIYRDGRANVAFQPSEVAVMLLLVKVARLANSPSHLDSWIDIAGYAACGAEVAGCQPSDGTVTVVKP